MIQDIQYLTLKMTTTLSNKQLFKRYKAIFSEHKSETVFENICSKTLTVLLFLEKEVTQRGYKIISSPKGELCFVK